MTGGLTREIAREYARAGVRMSRRRWRRRHVVAPYRQIVPAAAGGLELRLLRSVDGPGWSASMRANATRMRPWWPEVDDWEKATDGVAFAEHYLAWRRRMRQGSGIVCVVADDAGVAGEITVWHLSPGGQSAEVGIWMRPHLPPRALLAMWGAFFDNIFGNVKLERLESPVAVGNTGPARLISAVGGRQVATIPDYRSVAGALMAHDIYALRRDEWAAVRGDLWRKAPWPTVTDGLPELGGPR